MAPSSIRFMQATASLNFSNGGTVNGLANDLRSGATEVSDVPVIRVVEHNGGLWALDSRRLLSFSQPGVESIPVQVVSRSNPAVAAEFASKFNPIGGTSQFVVVTPSADRTAVEAVLRSYGLIF
jgi:hypothetical protein